MRISTSTYWLLSTITFCFSSHENGIKHPLLGLNRKKILVLYIVTKFAPFESLFHSDASAVENLNVFGVDPLEGRRMRK